MKKQNVGLPHLIANVCPKENDKQLMLRRGTKSHPISPMKVETAKATQ